MNAEKGLGRFTRQALAGLAAVLLGLSDMPARAGDFAHIEILGFSEDGRVFAFEEYGVQDGSGFPYASRYFLDTGSGSFLEGTPIRVRLESEGATLEQARAQVRTESQPLIETYRPQDNPGLLAAFNPATEHSADPHRVEINPRLVVPPVDAPIELRLEEVFLNVPQGCGGLGYQIKGFRLVMVEPVVDGDSRLLHEDEEIPASRRCPTGYRIGGAVTYHPEGGDPVLAVLVLVESIGFEGPDGRWIAVTTLLDE